MIEQICKCDRCKKIITYGEAAEFVSKRKLREVLEKMREYRDMEIKGVNFYKRPGVAERCFDLLQEVIK